MPQVSDWSRRGFLQGTAIAAAPLILPSGLWSKSLKGDGPNSRINLALVGMGMRLTGIAGSFSNFEDV